MTIYRMQASFGCLQGKTMELSPGFNLIEAPNESGKSTWCAFLVAMLYGINTRERDKKGAPAEKTRFRPWDGSPLEGLLECDYGGKPVILRRTSQGGVPFGSFSAVWAESGEVVPELTGENVGETITGVGREVFERSVLFRQGSLGVDQSHELEHRIAALLASGEEQTSWTQADAKLREWQRSRRYNKKGAIPQCEEEQALLTRRIEQLQQLGQERDQLTAQLSQDEASVQEAVGREQAENRAHREELEKRWAEAAAELDAAQLHLQSLEEPETTASKDEAGEARKGRLEDTMLRRGKRLMLWSGVGLLLSLLLLVAAWRELLPPAIPYWTIFLLGLLVVGGNLLRVRKDQRDRAELTHLELEEAARQNERQAREQERSGAKEREARAQERYTALTREMNADSQRTQEAFAAETMLSRKRQALALLTGRLQELGDPTILQEQREELQARIEQLQREYDALELAIGGLQVADRAIRERFSPELNARTTFYFSQLTEGAYEHVLFARDFTAQAEQPGSAALRSALLLSRGTIDQLYFALRLAICELILPEAAALPLFFDDALAAFDDRRATLALALLQTIAQQRQIVFFTCQSREGQLMKLASEQRGARA